MMKDGWVSVFSRDHPDLVNLSIGASSSVMGAYRSIFGTGMQAGDTLVWEYALNDANHVRKGHSESRLLRFVEHLLIHGRTSGIHFAPIIFTPLPDERNLDHSPYHRQLHDLLRAYQLAPFDMSIEYRQALGVQRLPREVFLNAAHYAHDDNVRDFIAKGATRAVARQPACP
ncbi:hypothetical protein RNZ50_23050 [Paracoccaceae bacterium Fryx2]|nr:hypothetical protein [Paracoccaceae bacterium Fryx2]